jgi:N-acetylmuramoyl-L-alanine amidase
MLAPLQVVARPAAVTNYSLGRKGHEISLIVIHVEEGSNEGTAKWFSDGAAHASAHYGIGRDGAVLAFVPEEETAWHAGNAEYNRRSIGIELEGHIADPRAFTEPMLCSLAALCADVCRRYALPVDRKHIIGHHEVPDPEDPSRGGGEGHHTDPGPYFPWKRFIAAVAAA